MKNEEEEKSEEKEKRETPIIDGDVRPDMNVDPDEKKKTSPLASERSRVSTDRGADVDKSEDYKDARLD